VRCNLNAALICISFIARDGEHFFVCFLVICISFENCLFSSFAHLLIGLFALLVFNFLSSLNILDISPLSDEWLQKCSPIL
jgi:hypothetical protein